jgi:hypothetical protein
MPMDQGGPPGRSGAGREASDRVHLDRVTDTGTARVTVSKTGE